MINTLTLNPALDQILFLHSVRRDVANRLTGSKLTIGGKGTHVSIDLALQGIPSRAFGLCQGEAGMRIIDFMKAYENIDVRFIHDNSAESRTNYLVIEDDGTCTILAGRGRMLTENDILASINGMKSNMSVGDSLIISGDASNCEDPFIYNRILEELKDLHIKAYLDASEKTLKSCISSHPFLIKPNQDELEQLYGSPITNEETLFTAVNSLDKYEIPIVAVSLGGNGSIVKYEGNIYRVHTPKVNVNNTIGCGDCFLSGIIYGLEKQLPFDKTLRYAAAISGSCAELDITTGFIPERVKEIEALVQIETH